MFVLDAELLDYGPRKEKMYTDGLHKIGPQASYSR
jgi:hypothetical protein